MRVYKYILFCLICVVSSHIQAKEKAYKNFYLVDNLDFQNLGDEDKILIDSCLKTFHACTDDTSRLKALNIIVENCWDDFVWPLYNQWVFDYINGMELKEKSDQERNMLLKLKSAALNNFGYLASGQGKTEEEIKYYRMSLEIDEEIDNKIGISDAFNNLGAAYFSMGDIETSLKFYSEAIKNSGRVG